LYAKNVLGTSTQTSFTVLMILNGLGFPGRVFPAFLADTYFGPVNTLIPCVVLLAILFFVWIAITSFYSLYAFVVLLGFIDASVQGIFMGSMTSLTTDILKVGTRIGMTMSIFSLASLCGLRKWTDNWNTIIIEILGYNAA
jgi:MFS family permease